MWSDKTWKVAWHCGANHISKSKCTKHTNVGPLLEVVTSTKVHTVVARSTFGSQKCEKMTPTEHFWKLRCRKSARRCGAKHISKSKCAKHVSVGTLLEVEMFKKCMPLWRQARFQVKTYKTPHARTTFEGSDVVLCGRRKGLCTLSKVSKTWGFCSISKNHGRLGTFEEDLQRCIFRGRRSTRDMMLGGQGADFLGGVAFWSIRSSGLGRWFCVTGTALRLIWHQFSWQEQHFRQMDWKNRKTHWYEAVSSALNFPFSKEVSQNSFVFTLADR